VCAPAGFGKSTTLANALAACPFLVAWLTLASEDGHVPRFIQALIAAIQRVDSRACRTTASLLQHPALPQPAAIADTLQHALYGDDLDAAVGLVETQAPLLLDRGDWHQLEEWLRLLPAATVERRPALVLAQAWIAHFRFKHNAIPALLQPASALLDETVEGSSAAGVAAWRAEVDSLWATVWFFRDDAERAATHAARAWERLPATAAWSRGNAGWILGVSRHRLGHSEAIRDLLATEAAGALKRHSAGTLRLGSSLAVVRYTSGEPTPGRAHGAPSSQPRRDAEVRADCGVGASPARLHLLRLGRAARRGGALHGRRGPAPQAECRGAP
jgi:ATP/maltotriose-dependent transcriptional regulator MalT